MDKPNIIPVSPLSPDEGVGPLSGRVLLIGSDTAESEQAAQTLREIRNARITVDQVGGIEEALPRLRARRFDLILLDPAADPGDPNEVLKEARRRYPPVPILFVGDAQTEAAFGLKAEEGLVEFLRKDRVDKGLLTLVVRSFLRAESTRRGLLEKLEEGHAIRLQYQALLRTTPDGLCKLDPNWNIVYANQSMNRIIDPSLNATQDLWGNSLRLLFPSLRDFESYREIAEKRVVSTGTDRREVRLVRWDGTPMWAQISVVLLDPQDHDAGYVATITDISDQKQAEEALRYREQFENLLMNISADFLELPAGELASGIQAALAKVGRFFAADRCLLFRINPDRTWESDPLQWCEEGAAPAVTPPPGKAPLRLDWLLDRLTAADGPTPLRAADVPADRPECGFLDKASVHSFLAIPLLYEHAPVGCVLFQSIRPGKRWSSIPSALLRFLGQVFVNAVRRQEIDDQLLKLSRVVEQAADSVVITDPEGTIEYVNPAFEAKTGYAAEEAVGKNPRILKSGMHEPEFYKALWETIRQGHPFHSVIINRRKTGELYYESQTISPVRDARGMITHFVSTAKDITDQKIAEEELRRSERRLRHLLEAPSVIPWEADFGTWDYTYVGPQAERILGYPVEQWLEPGFWMGKVHPDDLSWVNDYAPKASLQNSNFEFEFRMKASDGRVLWFRDIVNVEEREGKPAFLRGFLIDITEQKRLQEELLKNERLAVMGQTAAEVAHCMKNIFTALNGGMYLLEQALKMNRWDLTRRAFQTLRQSSTRLFLFVMNMLDYSKKRDVKKENVFVRSILEDVIHTLEASAVARNVSINCRVEKPAEILKLDSQGLYRTLLNLGINSVDAMPKGGSLEFIATLRDLGDLKPETAGIRAEAPASGRGAPESPRVPVIEVTDTGSGMAPEVLEHIFDPFYSTKGSRGTGLGLTSARKFIEEQGGEIRVTSQPGQGTTFYLVFPE